ncbi:3-keto-L-gulonate transporter [Desulfovibrionales bacterium]
MKQTIERPSLDTRILIGCFLRTYFVGAAFNTRGMQNVGLVFALEPGLRAIYPDPRVRQVARKRYLRHYNTHMFWTPLLVGFFLSLEDKIALQLFPALVLDNIKNTTIYTLSAIGDSVFAGSLLVFWALSTTVLVVWGLPWVALGLSVVWFLALQAFKVGTFWIGFREGLDFLFWLKRWDLINWGQRLKFVNAALTVLIFQQISSSLLSWQEWLISVALLGVSAWLVYRLHVPREVVLLAIIAYFIAVPSLSSGWGGDVIG